LRSTRELIKRVAVARTLGSRNADYEDTRLALARRLSSVVLGKDGVRVSLRQLAEAADTSVATLKHYFQDRDGVVHAVMESLRIDGAPHMALASSPVAGDLRESLAVFLKRSVTAWRRHGVGQMQASMLAFGLSTKALGPAYVTLLLEPFLQTGEALLQRHVELGELAPCDLRHAALTLMGPLMLALLHQDNLDGVRCRPLSMDAFIPAHVEAFLAAFPPAARARRPAR
jgi:AcrR family transcriptional regulator